MLINAKRIIKTSESTISEVFIGTEHECYILEDVDRGLTAANVAEKKVKGKSAIPAGKYRVIVTWSNRFQMYLPILVGVPGFDGVRIHPGNTAVDTEGCLLPGTSYSKDFVANSRKAWAQLNDKIKATINKGEEVWIEIG